MPLLMTSPVIIPLPVDYLAWTEHVAGIFTRAAALIRSEHAVSTVEARVYGFLSPRCREEFAKAAVAVKENITGAAFAPGGE